jgi:hypothetical protein
MESASADRAAVWMRWRLCMIFPSGTELETGAIFNTLQHSAQQAIT